MASLGQQAVDLALSRLGKNSYTQSSLRTQVFSGYSDCSSLVWKCYERLGIFVGTWTGEQVKYGRRIWVNPNHSSYAALPYSALSLMAPGDCIFYGSGNAAHVEMYMGNGQQIGHGSGNGPTIKNCLNYKHKSGVYQIRRYTDDNGSTSSSFEHNSSKLSVDGYWGRNTSTRLQQIFGTTVDGIVSNQWAMYKNRNPGLDSGWEWYYRPNGQGSELIRAMQRMAGVSDVDGEIGDITIRALQRYFHTTVDGYISSGSLLVKAIQNWANSRG